MTYTANKALSRAGRRLLDFDPDSASETIVDLQPGASGKLLPLADGFGDFVAGLFHSVGSDVIDSFRIFVADDIDGSVNAANVVSHALGSAPDAVGDYVWLEASAEQVKAASATAQYIGVKITLHTSTDECVVYFERSRPRFAYSGLTADHIS